MIEKDDDSSLDEDEIKEDLIKDLENTDKKEEQKSEDEIEYDFGAEEKENIVVNGNSEKKLDNDEKKDFEKLINDIDKPEPEGEAFLEEYKKYNESKYYILSDQNNLDYLLELHNSRNRDKAVKAKAADAIDFFKKKQRIARETSRAILTSPENKNRLGNFDKRDIENISLIFGTFNEKDFNEEEFRKQVTDITNAFLEYPYVRDQTKEPIQNDPEYLAKQTKAVSPYLDILNDFMIERVPAILASHDYNMDFTNMTTDEICALTVYDLLTQTFIKKNTDEYKNYFESKYDNYEKSSKFFDAFNKVNSLNFKISEEIDKYGLIDGLDGIYNNIGTEFRDIRLFTQAGIEACAKFAVDNSKIDMNLPSNFYDIKNNDVADDLNKAFVKMFRTFVDSSERGSKITSDYTYSLVYINGESLENIAFPKDPVTGRRNIPADKSDYGIALSNVLANAIKKGDKVIEYANLSDYKEFVNVKLVPIYFNYKDKSKTEKYRKVVENSLSTNYLRRASVEEDIKTKCDNYVDRRNNTPYKGTIIASQNQLNALNYLPSLLDNVNNNNLKESEEFNNLIDSINKDFENSRKLKTYNEDFSLNKPSTIYKDKEALTDAYKNIYQIEDYAYLVSDYVTNIPGKNFTKAVNRDLVPYFLSLKGLSLTERVSASLKYVNAISEREKGNFEPSREIQRELIDKFLKSRENCNFTKKANIYNTYVNTNLALVVQEMMRDDPKFVENLKKSDPAKYYNLINKCSELDNINAINDKEVFSNLNFTSNKGSKPTTLTDLSNYNTFSRTAINVVRNVEALELASLESKNTHKDSIDFVCDMSLYGICGTSQKLPDKSIANSSIKSLCDTIDKISDDFGLDVEYSRQFSSKEIALLSAEAMFKTYFATKQTNQFLCDLKGKDILEEDETAEFYFKSVYVNDKSIYSLAKDFSKEHPEYDMKRVGSAIFARALHNKNDVLSIASMSYNSKGELESSVKVMNKDYDEIVKQTEKNHSLFFRIMHKLGLKTYNTEKMRDDYKKALGEHTKLHKSDFIKADFEAKIKESYPQMVSNDIIRKNYKEALKTNTHKEMDKVNNRLSLDNVEVGKYKDDTNLIRTSLNLDFLDESKAINKVDDTISADHKEKDNVMNK